MNATSRLASLLGMSLLAGSFAGCEDCPTVVDRRPLFIDTVQSFPRRLDVGETTTITVYVRFDDGALLDMTEDCSFSIEGAPFEPEGAAEDRTYVELTEDGGVVALATGTADVLIDCNPTLPGTVRKPELVAHAWIAVEDAPTRRLIVATDLESQEIALFDATDAYRRAPLAERGSPFRSGISMSLVALSGSSLFVLTESSDYEPEVGDLYAAEFELTADGDLLPLRVAIGDGGALGEEATARLSFAASDDELFVLTDYLGGTLLVYGRHGEENFYDSGKFRRSAQVPGAVDFALVGADRAALLLKQDEDTSVVLLMDQEWTGETLQVLGDNYVETTGWNPHSIAIDDQDGAVVLAGEGEVRSFRASLGAAAGEAFLEAEGIGGLASPQRVVAAPSAANGDLLIDRGSMYLTTDDGSVAVFGKRAANEEEPVKLMAGEGSGFQARGSVVIAEVPVITITPTPMLLDVGEQGTFSVTRTVGDSTTDITAECEFSLRHGPGEPAGDASEDVRYVDWGEGPGAIVGLATGTADVAMFCAGNFYDAFVVVEEQPAQRYLLVSDPDRREIGVFDPNAPDNDEPLRRIALDFSPGPITLIGHELFVTDREASRFVVLDVRSNGEAVPTRELPDVNRLSALTSSEGSLLFTSDANYDDFFIQTMNPLTGVLSEFGYSSEGRASDIVALDEYVFVVGTRPREGQSDRLLVYPRHGNPLNLTLITAPDIPAEVDARQLAIDAVESVLFVSGQNGIHSYPLDLPIFAGDDPFGLAPLRSLAVPASGDVLFDKGALYVAGDGETVSQYGKRAIDDDAPVRKFAGEGSRFWGSGSIVMATEFAASECGNGSAEDGEACDEDDLAGETCETQGFASGTLACSSDCDTFDTSACVPAECGNDAHEGGEVCDGGDLDGEDCASQGFDSGTLGCDADCNGFDTAGCENDPDPCGNLLLDVGEACDGDLLDGETCVSLGFASGDLACDLDCQAFDTAGCVGGGVQRLFVVNDNSSDPGSIQVFAVDAEDPDGPLRTIEGPATLLQNPGQMAAQGGELFVVDVNSVLVFDVDDADDAAPARVITGPVNTRLDQPNGIAIVGDEIFVGNETEILVFDIGANGDEAPARVITSVGGIAPSFVNHMTTTTTPNEIMFPDGNGDRLRSFSITAGATPPALRTFTPPGISNTVAVVGSGGELFVSCRISFQGAVMVLSDDLNGTVLRTITGPATELDYPNGLEVSGGEIFVANTGGGEILVFDVGDDGAAPPSRKITLDGPISGEPPNPRSVLVTPAG